MQIEKTKIITSREVHLIVDSCHSHTSLLLKNSHTLRYARSFIVVRSTIILSNSCATSLSHLNQKLSIESAVRVIISIQ